MTAALDEARAAMSARSINDLPDSAFAYIEPGGQKDSEGRTVPRSLRHFPIHDEAHIRAALARMSQSPFGDKAEPKIRAAAKRMGIHMADMTRSADTSGEPRRSHDPTAMPGGMGGMGGGKGMGGMSGDDAEPHLMDLLADLTDDQIKQLAAIAEEMHRGSGEGPGPLARLSGLAAKARAGREGAYTGRATDQAGSECRQGTPETRTRSFEIDMRSVGNGDGRTLEGYVTIWGETARIQDTRGPFDEEIHRGAFDRSLRRSLPVMQFEHGRDPRVGALPIGTYEVFEPDTRGYYVRGRLLDDPLVDPIRKAIAARAVKGMSWRMIVPDAGQRWTSAHERRDRGEVQKRDVFDADVPEAGPVVFPAYAGPVVAVRSMLAAMDDDEIGVLVRELAAHAGLATDLTDFTGRPDARSVGGGEHRAGPSSGSSPEPETPLSPDELRTRHRVLRALGALHHA